MNKTRIIKVIIIIIVVLLLILGTIIVIINKLNNPNKEVINNIDNNVTNSSNDTSENTNIKISDVQYFIINTCISKYFSTVNVNNVNYFELNSKGELVKSVNDATLNKMIYNMLDTDYVEKNNITINNVNQFVKLTNKTAIYNIINITSINGTNKYLTYGILQDEDNNFIEKEYFIINIDKSKKCFSIEPILDTNNFDINNMSVINTDIDANDNNTYTTTNITQMDICRDYLLKIKRLMLTSPEDAYNYIDNDYKNAKFKTIEEFKKYIDKNKSRISNITLSKYKVDTTTDNVERYVGIDQYGNYYIINVTDVLNYTVMLDDFTIDVQEFTDKYNLSNDTTKVAMNIEKVRQAINVGDYDYIYSKLYNEFKTKYYPTESSLEDYLKSNMFTVNNFENTSTDEQNGTFIFTINVTDSMNSNSATKKMQVYMKLEDNNDFVMSFNIQQ